jgi:predicted anti-sigma-YlaC factor YlaD
MNLYELQCRQVVELLTDYLEDVLPAPQRVVLEQHLLFCEGCEHYLTQLRTSIDLTGKLLQEDVPTAVLDGLLGLLDRREEA